MEKQIEYTDEQKQKMGEMIADIFQLKKTKDATGGYQLRYTLGCGYHTKTAIGLFEVVRGIGQDIETGKMLEKR